MRGWEALKWSRIPEVTPLLVWEIVNNCGSPEKHVMSPATSYFHGADNSQACIEHSQKKTFHMQL